MHCGATLDDAGHPAAPRLERGLLLAWAVLSRHASAALLAWAATVAVHDARAQCANRTTSCMQCHEIDGRHRVRENGTAWHRDHALGDFCARCHGGNDEATDETEAHQGMVSPLDDSERSCVACHPGDHGERARRYAADAAARREAGGPPHPPAAPVGARSHDPIAGALAAALALGAGAMVAIVERARRRRSVPRARRMLRRRMAARGPS
jgi:hypothetical protein